MSERRQEIPAGDHTVIEGVDTSERLVCQRFAHLSAGLSELRSEIDGIGSMRSAVEAVSVATEVLRALTIQAGRHHGDLATTLDPAVDDISRIETQLRTELDEVQRSVRDLTNMLVVD
jgi:hypothetical protein